MAPEHPDVFLVVVDTARADHFGPFGGKARTPAFDDLARRGRAVRAVATAPWTVPSHASMFTGLLPFEHGVTGKAARTEDRRLASLGPAIARLSGRWLPEVFRRAGYRTVAVSANVWITPSMGFDLGFEEFRAVGMAAVTPRGADHHWRLRDQVPASARRRAKRAVRYLRDARRGRDFGAREALRALREMAHAERDRPLFCFVNVMECHAPYLPPAGFNPLSGWARLRGPSVNHRLLGDEFVAAFNLGAAEAPQGAVGILQELYAGEVAYADHFLGGLLELLGSRLADTVLAVTSDHGENLGEDHLLGHVLSLDERLLSVPLAVAGPGLPDLPGPAVSLASIPWALAEAAGVADHPYRPAGGAVALAQYESGWDHLRRAPDAVGRFRLSAGQVARLRAPMTAASDGETFVTRGPGGDSVTGPPAAVPALAAALDGAPSEPHAVSGLTALEEAEVEERLRELGYL